MYIEEVVAIYPLSCACVLIHKEKTYGAHTIHDKKIKTCNRPNKSINLATSLSKGKYWLIAQFVKKKLISEPAGHIIMFTNYSS